MSFLPDWMWSYNFPTVLLMQEFPLKDAQEICMQLANPVWPTAFGETVMSIIIFVYFGVFENIKIPGLLFFYLFSF